MREVSKTSSAQSLTIPESFSIAQRAKLWDSQHQKLTKLAKQVKEILHYSLV